MTFNEYFLDWSNYLDEDCIYKALRKINTDNISHSYKDIFKAFTFFQPNECKCVLLGQDPYPQKNVATGLAFGNKKDTTSISPSLRVLKNSFLSMYNTNDVYFDITLESLAKQGVLLLNSALTCEVNKIGSHYLIWKDFISKFLYSLSNNKKNVVYLLLGNQAQSFESYIQSTDNVILKCKHPSFYARYNSNMPNDTFYKINECIYENKIQWCTKIK